MANPRFTPGPGTERAFRDALGLFATGVTIVTCRSDKGPVGITANSFSSVSLDPPLVLWSPARASRRFETFVSADSYGIHILAADQKDMCERFTRDGLAFEGLDYVDSDNGTPLLSGVLASFECRRHAVHDGGDHAIIVGRVLSVQTSAGDPLVFSAGSYGAFHPEQ